MAKDGEHFFMFIRLSVLMGTNGWLRTLKKRLFPNRAEGDQQEWGCSKKTCPRDWWHLWMVGNYV
jgi:hypothetical protein